MSIEEDPPRQPGAEPQGEGSSQPPTPDPKQNPDRRSLLTLAAELKDSVRRDQMYRSKRARDPR